MMEGKESLTVSDEEGWNRRRTPYLNTINETIITKQVPYLGVLDDNGMMVGLD